jgi:hypothetical protein
VLALFSKCFWFCKGTGLTWCQLSCTAPMIFSLVFFLGGGGGGGGLGGDRGSFMFCSDQGCLVSCYDI